MMGASSLEDANSISFTLSEGSEEGEGDGNEEEDYVNCSESHAGDDLVGGIDVANFAAPMPPLLPLPPPVLNEVPPVQNEVVAAIEGGVVAAIEGGIVVAIEGGAVQN